MRLQACLALVLSTSAQADLLRERCAWTGSVTAPAFDDVIMSPLVVDLDGDAVPEVLALARSEFSAAARLVAISGADCSELWSVGDVGCQACVGDAACRDLDPDDDDAILMPWGLAAGDLDRDGRVEIVAVLQDGPGFATRLIVFDADGHFLWCSEPRPGRIPHDSWVFPVPSIADLDADGSPEILVGARGWTSEGRLVAESPLFDRFSHASFAMDLDGDGDNEVVIGACVFGAGMRTIWHREELTTPDPSRGRHPFASAAADLDGDGLAEVIVTDELLAGIHVLDGRSGATRTVAPFPRAVSCREMGAPAVGDMDGDGSPEIVVSSGNDLCLYSWSSGPPESLVPLWCEAVTDCSRSWVSPTLADVNADGLPEILHRDTQYLRVLDSAGATLQSIRTVSSTLAESVVAADVDGDCSGELVTAADGDSFGVHGVRIFEGDDAPLPAYRPLWNQTAYHVTNVTDDGAIPTSSSLSRAFRAQRQDEPLGTVRTSRSTLWPPNHRLVRVRLQSDDGSPVRVLSVRQDEPVDDRGDGSHAPDAVIDAEGVLLRAERDGRGDGRTYHLEVAAGHGACGTVSTVTVCVPHDRRPGRRPAPACGDQGPLFDSTVR